MTPAFQDICKAALVPLLICVFHAAVTTSAPGHVGGHALHKRNAIQLCNLMTRYTDRYCTDYSNYGCFCGYGGIGNNPVDDVDRCCYDHDKCYAEALDSCWYYWYIFLVRYTYECVGEKCTCTDSSYWHPCARIICQCDVQFGECLAWTRYNNAFWKYSKKGKCI